MWALKKYGQYWTGLEWERGISNALAFDYETAKERAVQFAAQGELVDRVHIRSEYEKDYKRQHKQRKANARAYDRAQYQYLPFTAVLYCDDDNENPEYGATLDIHYIVMKGTSVEGMLAVDKLGLITFLDSEWIWDGYHLERD